MIKEINVRFFTYCTTTKPNDFDGSTTDIMEVTEAQFMELIKDEVTPITYSRHSVFQNGSRDICLTVEPFVLPDEADLEIYSEEK